MDYISVTELRTKSKELIEALRLGKRVKLLHRSKVIGEVSSKQVSEKANGKEFLKALDALRKSKAFEDVTPRNWKSIYRKRLEEKYGKRVS